MTATKRYGAASFVLDEQGRPLIMAAAEANYPLGAVSAAGRLRAELIAQLTHRVGVVAFESSPTGDGFACLFAQGAAIGPAKLRGALGAAAAAEPIPLPMRKARRP
jgi:hypothetical protein